MERLPLDERDVALLAALRSYCPRRGQRLVDLLTELWEERRRGARASALEDDLRSRVSRQLDDALLTYLVLRVARLSDGGKGRASEAGPPEG